MTLTLRFQIVLIVLSSKRHLIRHESGFFNTSIKHLTDKPFKLGFQKILPNVFRVSKKN